MSYIPSRLRRLRRKARRRLQRYKKEGEQRTKREMWEEGLSELDRMLLEYCGYTPESFWKDVRRGWGIRVPYSRRDVESCIDVMERERDGQLNLVEVYD